MRYIFFIPFLLVVLIGCGDSTSIPIQEVEKQSNEIKTDLHPGEKLLQANCYACHGASSDMEGRIAPPMIAIKAHYIDSLTEFEDFSKEFLDFLNNPNEEKAKMRGAVRKFGVMPKQNFKKEDLLLIAEFLFDYKIDEPEWFKEHWGEKHEPYFNEGKEIVNLNLEANLEEIGLEYVIETKKLLGKNLMQQIQKNGTVEALSFCNQNAISLTDSMSNYFQVEIRRVSDKNRNPDNKADEMESSIIKEYEKLLSTQQEIKPIIKDSNFYYPILTNSMCIQCHGIPSKDVSSEVTAKLNQLYPNDKAIGYEINQVRGIWSIKMREN